MGGIFDPITGKRDESKLKTVREHLLRELNSKFHADALAHPSIQSVKAQSDLAWIIHESDISHKGHKERNARKTLNKATRAKEGIK